MPSPETATARCEHLEHATREGQRQGRTKANGRSYWVPCDTDMGAYVYCAQHVRPHSTGWCSVSHRDKTLLKATTLEEAIAEARALGLRIHPDDA